MELEQIAPQLAQPFRTVAPIFRFFATARWTERAGAPDICDFVVGNPHEMPLPAISQTLQRWAVPQNKDWFAYKGNETKAQQTSAASLSAQLGIEFDPEDILMTTGAFGALTVALNTLIGPGDEVVFISPPWFFYEGLIANACGVPVRVKIDPTTMDLDLQAISEALTAKTQAILINTPHNPTGKIYPAETLQALADLLNAASRRYGHPIYLLSDEAYRKIVFDGRPFHSPAAFYDNTLVIYTYGKTLLIPGQRLGYIALSPRMSHREAIRSALFVGQFFTGYAFPNALLQHAIEDLEALSIDISQLQQKRDRLVKALREAGYEVHTPEGTFYLLPRSPWADDERFVERLAADDVFCLPGTLVERPGYFRISLTASDEMIERAIPRFAAAFQENERF